MEFDWQVRTKHKYIQTIRKKLKERNKRCESKVRRQDATMRGGALVGWTTRRLLKRENDFLRKNASRSAERSERDVKKVVAPKTKTGK